MLAFIKGLIIYAIGIILSLYIIDKLVEEDLEYRTAVITGMSIFWILLIPLGIVISIIEFIHQEIKIKRFKKNWKKLQYEKYWEDLGTFQAKVQGEFNNKEESKDVLEKSKRNK